MNRFRIPGTSNPLPLVAGAFVACWALLVLGAWHGGELGLAQLHDDWAPMPYDTALGLFLCGMGLASAALGSWRIVFACSLLAGLIATITLFGQVFQSSTGLASWLVTVELMPASNMLVRMAPNTAGALALCSLMLIAIGYGLRKSVDGYNFSTMLGLLVALIGLLSLFSHLSALYMEPSWKQLVVMTPPVAVAFALLGLATAIFRWPDDAHESVDITRLQQRVITYVSAGVIIIMLFSAAIGLLPLYELLRLDPAAWAELNGIPLDASLQRQLALTGIVSLVLAYIGGFGVWRLLRPLTGRILMRADALEKTIKKATEDLEASVKDLRRSNRQLDQFARVASHDLQAPLHGITGFARIIEDKYGAVLGTEGREFLGYISSGALQMQAQIRGLLELSRLHSKGQPRTLVSIAEVIDQILTYLQPELTETAARLQYRDLPQVECDRTQIVLLFQNLITNAIKFQQPGQVPEITITAQREAAFWRFNLRDNGIGIDPAHKDRIFDLFSRLHSQDTYPGTGIGLALCREIVERHGGEITVHSQPGMGSTFSFTLPAGSHGLTPPGAANGAAPMPTQTESG